MADYCNKCLSLNWKNKATSSIAKYWCKELHRYVEPNNRSCSYFREDKGQPSSKGSYKPSGCFLTTACLRHLKSNFDDNCYELTMLRWLRDNYVSDEDIHHYYEIAPIIVEVLDNDPNGETAYDYIYNNVIKKCVSDIENDEIEKAYERYKNSVMLLEEKFARPVLEQRLISVLRRVRT